MTTSIRSFRLSLNDIWRYRWRALMLAWTVAVAGWIAVALLPDKYEASASIYVDTDSILQPLLEGLAVRPDYEQRLQIMTRTLLSRPNLEKVARSVDFDLDVTNELQLERKINRLHDAIDLTNEKTQENLYRISYTHQDRTVAKAVVQSLLSIFIESTLGETRQDSDNAQQFLQRQINEYKERLQSAENRLMEFKRDNYGVLPSQEGGFFNDLRAAQRKHEEVRLELQEAQYKRAEIKKQIDQLRESYAEGEIASDGSLSERITALQAQLDDKRLRYTEEHPDVVALKRTIEQLKEQRAQESRNPSSGGQPADRRLEDSHMYQELTLALSEVEADIASIRVREKDYSQRVEELKKRISTLPEVEAQLTRLTRDYDITKTKYEELVSRYESARLSESAGKTGDNVKFKIVNPPWVPREPSAPNRLLLSTLVLLGALGGGVTVSLTFAYARPVIYDLYTLSEIVTLPIYGAVTRIRRRASLGQVMTAHGSYVALLLGLLAAYGYVAWLSANSRSLSELYTLIGSLV